MAIKRRKKKKPKQPKKAKQAKQPYSIPQSEEEMMALVGLAMNSEWAAAEPELANAKLFDPFDIGVLYDEVWTSLGIPDFTGDLSQEEQTGYFVQLYGKLFAELIDKKTQAKLVKIFHKMTLRFQQQAISPMDQEKVKALMGIHYIIDHQPPAQWITIGALTTLIDQYVETYHDSLHEDRVSEFGDFLENITEELGLINFYLFNSFMPNTPHDSSLVGEPWSDDEELWRIHLNGLLSALIHFDLFTAEELEGLEAEMDLAQDVADEAVHNGMIQKYLDEVSGYLATVVTADHRDKLIESVSAVQKMAPSSDNDRFCHLLLQHIRDDSWWDQYQNALYVRIFLGEGISLGIDMGDDVDDEAAAPDAD